MTTELPRSNAIDDVIARPAADLPERLVPMLSRLAGYTALALALIVPVALLV